MFSNPSGEDALDEYSHVLSVFTILCVPLQRSNGLKVLFDPKINLRERVVFFEEQGFSESQVGMLTLLLLIVVNGLSLVLRLSHIL